jgi:ABC-type antimicrobial peptide transport system permease subunit
LGQTIETRSLDKTSGKTTSSRFPVVGIAGDSVFDVYDHTGKPNRAVVYFLAPPALKRQNSADFNIDFIVVRMKGNPDTSRRLLEKTLEETTPEGMYFQVGSPQDQLNRFLYPYRTITAIGGLLGGLALLLTTSGIFGMLSYVITQRRKELGIRMALGAGKACVTGMVLRQSVGLAAAGCGLGALTALAVARLLSHFTNKVEFFDAGGYAAGVLLVIAAALAASWLPARRAVNLDPARTLRCD